VFVEPSGGINRYPLSPPGVGDLCGCGHPRELHAHPASGDGDPPHRLANVGGDQYCA
jgi:hypothetical protein